MKATPKEPLSIELKTFQREKAKLLADKSNLGQFALIRGSKVEGVYGTFDAALSAGYDKFGLDPFLVKEIVETDEPRYFSRNLR